jgi:hypothetical protein
MFLKLNDHQIVNINQVVALSRDFGERWHIWIHLNNGRIWEFLDESAERVWNLFSRDDFVKTAIESKAQFMLQVGNETNRDGNPDCK